MEEIVIDGKNATLGRLASYTAKQVLLGKKIVIINSNEIIITGKKKDILSKYQVMINKGGSSLKGPKIIRSPERIMKRTIRGMLSHKQNRGSEALKRVICYNDTPEKYSEAKKIRAGKEKKTKFVTLKELSSLLK
ncbi:50S ribosomal protein L13 [Candidatus Pacearchaeota archaeon]|nr:50S ribosomal protein L13 [Candidatus Pacearchaeota archaeon]|tara:strand:- start:331 stop:735 length:405 start_codon:yes stop_codon:yes gene_type:complete